MSVTSEANTAAGLDLITAEIVRQSLETTCAEMIETMIRSSLSPIFNEAHDCSAGVFYYDGASVSLVARADALPIHIYACLASVEKCLEFFHGDLADGDVLIVSDPYFGGTHLPDFTVLKPVFFEGRPLFFPSVRGHVLDVGGPVAGGANMAAFEIWQEGFRFSPMKLVDGGRPRREVFDLLRANNRLPDMVVADIESMIGACTIGEQRIRALAKRYGRDAVVESVDWILDYSERAFRDRIRQWPDGTYRGLSLLDSDYAERRNVRVEVAITIAGDEIEADFSGSDPEGPGPVNSPPANTLAYLFSTMSALCPDIPINSGFFRPLRAHIPGNTVVGVESPASVGNCTTCIGSDIGEAVMDACQGFAADLVGGGVAPVDISFVYGVDGRTGQFYVLFDFYASPVSTSGVKGLDGWGAYPALFCALTLPSIEMTEVQYPVLYRRAEFSIDSAAPGQWRGSPGFETERLPHNAQGTQTLNLAIQSFENPLHGWVNGRPGPGTYAVVARGTPREQPVTQLAFLLPQENAEPLYFHKGAGGGWGDPLDRDPEAVLADVMDGLVSPQGALDDYGVKLDEDAQRVVVEATRETRERRRGLEPSASSGRRHALQAVGRGEPTHQPPIRRT
jgi:N-methylhydantoinase B